MGGYIGRLIYRWLNGLLKIRREQVDRVLDDVNNVEFLDLSLHSLATSSPCYNKLNEPASTP